MDRLFRKEAESNVIFKEEAFIVAACKYYNMLIDPSCNYWRDINCLKKKIIKKFGDDSLSELEKNETTNLVHSINISKVFQVFSYKIGITLRPEILEKFCNYEKYVLKNKSIKKKIDEDKIKVINDICFSIEFVIEDFETIISRVKGLKFSSIVRVDGKTILY